jgi:O-antigen/teichoic acid export membrane protein
LSLAKNSGFTLIANLSLALSNWLLLVILTKYFPAKSLGEVVISLSVLSPLFLFTSFKLRTLVVVDLENENLVVQYFNARFLANTVALLIAPILWLVFLSDITGAVFFAVVAYRWFDAWCELCYSYLQRIQSFKQVSKSQTLRSVTSTLALIASSLLFHSIQMTLLSWVLTVAAFALKDLWLVSRLVKQHEKQVFPLSLMVGQWQYYVKSVAIYKKYMTVSFALMFSSLFVFIPNYFLKAYAGIESAGKFAAVSYVLVAGSILITSVSQVASPMFSRLLMDKQHRAYFRLAIKMCGVGLSIGFIGFSITALFGEWILRVVYSPEFALLAPELNWIMAAAMVRYSYIFLGTSMNALKLFKFQTQIGFVGTAIILVACFVLVPEYGTLGAAISMFMATCIELTLYLFRFYNIRKQQLWETTR